MTGLPALESLAARAERHERAGEWDDARATFSELFQAAVSAGRTAAAVDALRGKARILRLLHRLEEAEEAAELSLRIAGANGLAQAAARALNLLAVIHYSRREWARAEELFAQALDLGLDCGDDETVGLACQNLGVIANITGNLREARIRYLESIGSAVRSGRKLSEAMAYNNLGMVCADLGNWLEAQLYFDRGIEIAERIGDQAQTARLYANRAEPLVRMGDAERALESLDRAEEIGTRIGALATLADAARFRGVIARLQGDLAAAGGHLDRSLSLAAEAGAELARAEALEEMARLRWDEGLRAQAEPLLREAGARFAALGAERDAARVDEALENWAR